MRHDLECSLEKHLHPDAKCQLQSASASPHHKTLGVDAAEGRETNEAGED